MISRRSLFSTIAAFGAWAVGIKPAAPQGLRIPCLLGNGGDGVALNSVAHPAWEALDAGMFEHFPADVLEDVSWEETADGGMILKFLPIGDLHG